LPLQNPTEKATYYEDDYCYACLATDSRVDGHSIVAWKEPIENLWDLSREERSHFWDIVSDLSSVLHRYYEAPKVYVAFLNEANHVHVHVAPRVEEQKTRGFALFDLPVRNLEELDFTKDVKELKRLMTLECKTQ
jgi:diadenosine tetraphosphate (Ap4A) HIT family hydrolase